MRDPIFWMIITVTGNLVPKAKIWYPKIGTLKKLKIMTLFNPRLTLAKILTTSSPKMSYLTY
jgi:hypothetical protein